MKVSGVSVQVSGIRLLSPCYETTRNFTELYTKKRQKSLSF
ncbi:hypothetical protein D1AOALGA4SA_11981 [Olavius algarvensis Delta 1 endosymbiont]|nr:hypothetical protein D1AOALGA4SA_11981 [Olavius algarvensis Delta 1 endosymbiont]